MIKKGPLKKMGGLFFCPLGLSLAFNLFFEPIFEITFFVCHCRLHVAGGRVNNTPSAKNAT